MTPIPISNFTIQSSLPLLKSPQASQFLEPLFYNEGQAPSPRRQGKDGCVVFFCLSVWIPVVQAFKSLTCHCFLQFMEHHHPLYLSPSDLLSGLLFPLNQVQCGPLSSSFRSCVLYLWVEPVSWPRHRFTCGFPLKRSV